MSHEDIVKTSIGYFLKAFKLDNKNAREILTELTELGISKVIEPVRKKEKDEHDKLQEIREKAEYEKMIKAEPKNPYNYLSFGQFCFGNGLLNLGESNFLTAIKIDPQNRFAYYNDLSPSYYACGCENYDKDLLPHITKNAFRYALHSIELSPNQATKHLE
jgi:hypothetical protein